MESFPLRERLGDAVHFTAITDPKFKHNRLSIHLTVPLRRETASAYALVPFILKRGFKGCESHTELARRLGMLYGAYVDAGVTKQGCLQVITLAVQAIDDRYALDGEAMVRECAGLLADILLRPVIDESGFKDDVVALEKKNLKDAILAEINDKRSYAITRCHALMDADSPASINRLGYAEDVDAITPAAAADAYRQLMETAHMEIIFVGSGDPEPAKQLFGEALKAQARQPHDFKQPDFHLAAETVTEVVEPMDVAQAKLVMGLRTGTRVGERVAPTRVMAAILGGTPASLLFTNVREKLSLCYYCAARFDRTTGVMLIESGVSGDKAEMARAAMLDQLESIRRGDFTEELHQNTLRMMKNALANVGETHEGLEVWCLNQILAGKHLTPAEDYAGLEAVTRTEIIEAARAVTLDTVYLLREKEGAAQ